MTSLISVIIPTYNRKNIVLGSIESVLKQKPKNYEVLVVDDGSTDGTVKYLQSLNLPIRIIEKENGGAASARNMGIKEARGKYIAFLDSDDLWLPGILKTQLEFLESHPEAPLVYVDQHVEIKGKRIKMSRFGQKNFTHQEMSRFDLPTFAKSSPISLPSVMAKSSLFNEVGYFNESLKRHEDTDMWNRITEKYEVGYIRKPLVIFRRNFDPNHLQKPSGRKEFINEGIKYLELYVERRGKLTKREEEAVELSYQRIEILKSIVGSLEKGEITEQEFSQQEMDLYRA
jgi:glycosyltransferase involved in cell wall biosynthesis